MSSELTSLLSMDNLDFIQQGVSINLASRNARLAPSLARALSCRLSDCGGRLRISVPRSQAVELIRDVERFGVLAAVFTEPSTHRTLQIKGSNAQVMAADDADRERLQHNRQAFARDIAQLGFDAAFTERLYFVAPDDLVVLDYRPDAVFQQTPGPNAGEPLAPSP